MEKIKAYAKTIVQRFTADDYRTLGQEGVVNTLIAWGYPDKEFLHTLTPAELSEIEDILYTA